MSLSVAIIEPDTNIASAVEQTFTGLGFSAFVLSDGDVMEFVRTHAPSVILLNVELPHGSGYSFCNRLKKQADLKEIPIILTSGRETAEAFAEHQRQATPADAYMRKPFSVDQLVQEVGRLLPGAFDPSRAPVAATTTTAAVRDVASPAADVAARPAAAAPPAAPPRRERAKSDRGPTFEELIAQGRTEAPLAAPPTAAGPEAKLTFLRETLKQKEQDLGRARELWTQREREVAQLQEVLELRERELERARKAREDLLSQLTNTEDQVAGMRLDVEMAAERTERLDREKKALADELENATGDLERNIASLQTKIAQLTQALASETGARVEENDRSATEIRDLVQDLERTRNEALRQEANANEVDSKRRADIGDLQARIAGLEVEIAALRGKLTDAQKDADAVRRELVQLRADKTHDDDRARELVEDLEGRIRDLSMDKEGVEAELAKSSLLLADSNQSVDNASNKIVDLEAQIADLDSQLADKSNQVEMSETRAAELGADLADAQQHALELSSDKHRLEQKVLELSNTLAAANARIERAEQELDDAKTRHTAHAREVETRVLDLRDKNADQDVRLREAADALALLDAQAKETDAKLQDKHREHDAERVNRQKDVLKRDQRIGDLEARVRELDAQLHETERVARQKEADLSHALDLSKAHGEEVDRDLHRAKAKGAELETLLTDARDKNAELIRDVKKGELQLSRVNEELQAAQERGALSARHVAEHRERLSLVESELNDERQNRVQDVQTRDAALDRTNAQATEKLLRANESLQQLKGDLASTQTELQGTLDRLARVEERATKLELALDAAEQEKDQLLDRAGVLDNATETAQARSEQLTDELGRLKAMLKRAQDETAQAKRDRVQVEERVQLTEATMIKRLDEVKLSAVEAKQSVLSDVERVSKERDEARAKEQEIRRKAEQLMRKYRELEAQQQSRGATESERVERMTAELHSQKEARAREGAQFKAEAERLQSQLSAAANTQAVASEGEMTTLRAQVKEKDDRLTRASLQYNELKDKARQAIERVKDLDSRLKNAAAAGDGDAKALAEQLRGKYNEAVTKLKQQAELNKRIDAAHRELAEKHRKALLALKEYRELGAGESTQVHKAPVED